MPVIIAHVASTMIFLKSMTLWNHVIEGWSRKGMKENSQPVPITIALSVVSILWGVGSYQ